TIADAKRGDIGSTMAGCAAAWLTSQSPLAADAVTLSAYLGSGSLRPSIGLALAKNRGVFVLARTAHPEGTSVPHRGSSGRSAAERIVDAAGKDSQNAHRLGSIGRVVGATVTAAAKA